MFLPIDFYTFYLLLINIYTKLNHPIGPVSSFIQVFILCPSLCLVIFYIGLFVYFFLDFIQICVLIVFVVAVCAVLSHAYHSSGLRDLFFFTVVIIFNE